jgi:hypothetical protein
MPAGGKRRGCGPAKGSKRRIITAREHRVLRAAELLNAEIAAKRPVGGQQLSKDMLSHLANRCFVIASKFAPVVDEKSGRPVWPFGEAAHLRWLEQARLFAATVRRTNRRPSEAWPSRPS